MGNKLADAKCFLFDMDGTVYLGDHLLPGARELTAYLEKLHIPYYFLTNNSSRSREDYVKKLAGFGLPVTLEKIFSSGQAHGSLPAKKAPRRKLVSGWHAFFKGGVFPLRL